MLALLKYNLVILKLFTGQRIIDFPFQVFHPSPSEFYESQSTLAKNLREKSPSKIIRTFSEIVHAHPPYHPYHIILQFDPFLLSKPNPAETEEKTQAVHRKLLAPNPFPFENPNPQSNQPSLHCTNKD